MHDPMVVAFEIKRPWPRTSKLPGKLRTWYWPAVVTVWHREPGGHDALTVCRYTGWWRLHVHHWRLQFPPLQGLRRWLFTRCAWCAGRHRRRDRINHSLSWDRPERRWWRSEADLYHSDCASVATAHRTCLCDDPVLVSEAGFGHCLRCHQFRPYGLADEVIRLRLELRANILPMQRKREVYDEIMRSPGGR